MVLVANAVSTGKSLITVVTANAVATRLNLLLIHKSDTAKLDVKFTQQFLGLLLATPIVVAKVK